MKKLLNISLLLAVFLFQARGQADSLYTLAGEAYTEGRFEEALVHYQAILDQGYASADLYYNMGNAAFRSNKLGYSVLYYEKALKMEPGHDQAQANLEYVSQYREDQFEEVPEIFIRTWVKAVYRLFSLHSWSILSLVFFALLLAGIVFYVFSRRLAIRKTGFFTAMLSLVFFVLSLTAALNRNREVIHPERAVIIGPSVVVKSSPSQTGTDLFILHEGTTVRTTGEVGEWTGIRIVDGRVGWVPGVTLAMI